MQPTQYHFTQLQSQATGFSANWTVPQDLPFLEGHFPGSPVLPAAIIMEVSLALLKTAARAAKLRVQRARQCKFKAPVVPGTSYIIRATGTTLPLAAGPSDWHVVWQKAVTVAANAALPTGQDVDGDHAAVELLLTVTSS